MISQRVPVVMEFTINRHIFRNKYFKEKKTSQDWSKVSNQNKEGSNLVSDALLPLKLGSGASNRRPWSEFLGLSVWHSPWVYHSTTCSLHFLWLLIVSAPRHNFSLMLSSQIHHEGESFLLFFGPALVHRSGSFLRRSWFEIFQMFHGRFRSERVQCIISCVSHHCMKLLKIQWDKKKKKTGCTICEGEKILFLLLAPDWFFFSSLVLWCCME